MCLYVFRCSSVFVSWEGGFGLLFGVRCGPCVSCLCVIVIVIDRCRRLVISSRSRRVLVAFAYSRVKLSALTLAHPFIAPIVSSALRCLLLRLARLTRATAARVSRSSCEAPCTYSASLPSFPSHVL